MQHKEFYYWLDPLRALSALFVLFVHVRTVLFEQYDNLVPMSQNVFTQLFFMLCGLGGFSVCMFYILSGFLVGGRTITQIIDGRASAKRFLFNRLFRLGVPLTGALCLIVIVNLILGEKTDFIQLLGQYTGLQGVIFRDYGGVFWTLPYEIWFYAILLAVIIISHNRRLLIGTIMLMLSLLVFSRLLPQFLYIIPLGIICYYLKDHRISRRVMTILWISMPILFISYLIGGIHSLAVRIGYIKYSQIFIPIIQIVLFTNISVLISQYVLQKPENRISIFLNRYGKSFAAISYTLFLTHYQVLRVWSACVNAYNQVTPWTIGAFVAVCIICILFAYLMYLVFERNTSKVQNRIETFINDKFNTNAKKDSLHNQ